MSSGIRDAVNAATDHDTEEFDTLAHDPDAVEVEASRGADSSILAAIRDRGRQLRAENTTTIPIPGYDNLVGVYRAITITRFYTTSGGQLHNPVTEWGIAADALATALVSLYGLGSGGELVPLYKSEDPARFDDELVSALGLNPPSRTARAVLAELCGGGELGQSRVWSHFLDYQTWLMEGSAREVASDAVGESSPGR